MNRRELLNAAVLTVSASAIPAAAFSAWPTEIVWNIDRTFDYGNKIYVLGSVSSGFESYSVSMVIPGDSSQQEIEDCKLMLTSELAVNA